MVRSFVPPIGALFLLAISTSAWANPSPADAKILNAVAVQKAMEQARDFLHAAQPARAVAVLEEHLERINGNSAYLSALREAYRSHIQDLWSANHEDEARKYLKRLCVLDARAAQDPIMTGASRPQKNHAPVPAEVMVAIPPGPPAAKPMAAPPAKPLQLPTQSPPVPENPFRKFVQQHPVLASVRDPFDVSQKRQTSDDNSAAWKHQARAEAEFARQNFDEAHRFFERAYLSDARTLDASREHWAFCILDYVGEKVCLSSATVESLDELRKLVTSAIGMSPGLADAGQQLHNVIERRRGEVMGRAQSASARGEVIGQVPSASDGNSSVKLLGSKDGWQVAESEHFRIMYRNQAETFVEKVARAAEKTRLEMSRKWFGKDGTTWTHKCELFLHPTVEDYSRATQAPMDSTGHASIASSGAAVVSRRIDLHSDQNGLLETILPRETTHVVMAGMFGTAAVPLWADVGMASLTETAGRVGQHRRNLARACEDKALFGVRELLQLPSFPAAHRIKAFYGQSVVLVEFLTRERGPTVFTDFVRDSLRDGYEKALRQHYGWDFNELESHWTRYVASETSRLAKLP